MIELLREHALQEDMHILPLVGSHDGDLARPLARTHAQMEALQVELSVLLDRVEGADGESRLALAPTLTSLVNRLVAGHLLHMDAEECDANALLWAHAPADALAQPCWPPRLRRPHRPTVGTSLEVRPFIPSAGAEQEPTKELT